MNIPKAHFKSPTPGRPKAGDALSGGRTLAAGGQ
jgi:hypothetical protein